VQSTDDAAVTSATAALLACGARTRALRAFIKPIDGKFTANE